MGRLSLSQKGEDGGEGWAPLQLWRRTLTLPSPLGRERRKTHHPSGYNPGTGVLENTRTQPRSDEEITAFRRYFEN